MSIQLELRSEELELCSERVLRVEKIIKSMDVGWKKYAK